MSKQKPEQINEEEILDYLTKKKAIVDGVCITGGEPTMQKDLVEFCRKVKDLGLEIKLDTNGSNPEVVGNLIRRDLLDYVAVDIKTQFAKYSQVAKCQMSNVKCQIERTLKILKDSKIDFELRTTVVPGLHDEKIIGKMAREIRDLVGENVRWWLQNFRGGKCLDKRYNKKRSFSEKELNRLKVRAEGVIKGVKVRES